MLLNLISLKIFVPDDPCIQILSYPPSSYFLKKFRKSIPKLVQHLIEFGDSYEESMNIKYKNALNQGFIEKLMPPVD